MTATSSRPWALKAQQPMGCEKITALADRGYFNGDQVLSCEGTGVAPIVPKTLTSSGAKRGFFTRQDFIYNAEHDHYTCPAGAKLTKIHRRADHTEDFDRYRHLSACSTCPLRPRCTPTQRREVARLGLRFQRLRERKFTSKRSLHGGVREFAVRSTPANPRSLPGPQFSWWGRSSGNC